MSDQNSSADRRSFLKIASALAATVAVTGCTFETRVPGGASGSAADRIPGSERLAGFDQGLLTAVGTAVLPAELGEQGQQAAIKSFVAWADGYDPVAEEMHGYGYSDIRYLPADPSPAWRAQLTALDLLARRSRQKPFGQLPVDVRRELLTIALTGVPGDRLPDPLTAPHIALALMSHWASSPDARDLAFGAKVQAGNCRVLGDANARPLPITGLRA
jgi:hypothetical protein